MCARPSLADLEVDLHLDPLPIRRIEQRDDLLANPVLAVLVDELVDALD